MPPSLLGLAGIWAFVESGLGGAMHALKLPFTGIWVGGTAVAVLIVMAGVLRGRYEAWGHAQRVPRHTIAGTLLRATMVVMAVKLMASPHSPPTAYLAVGFQGVSAAFLLSWFRPFRLGAILFAALSMFESAIQKLLIMTLLYGKAWIDALESMTLVANQHLGTEGGGLGLLWVYLGLYLTWGLVLGIWASGWSSRPPALHQLLLRDWAHAQSHPLTQVSSPSTWKRPVTFAIILLSILTGLSWGGASADTLLWVAFRSLLATGLMLMAMGPVRVWLKRKLSKTTQHPESKDILNKLSSQGDKFQFCWAFSGRHHVHWQRPFRTLEYFIHLDLMNR